MGGIPRTAHRRMWPNCALGYANTHGATCALKISIFFFVGTLKKKKLFDAASASRRVLVPFVVDTFGALGSSALDSLKHIITHYARRTILYSVSEGILLSYKKKKNGDVEVNPGPPPLSDEDDDLLPAPQREEALGGPLLGRLLLRRASPRSCRRASSR